MLADAVIPDPSVSAKAPARRHAVRWAIQSSVDSMRQ